MRDVQTTREKLIKEYEGKIKDIQRVVELLRQSEEYTPEHIYQSMLWEKMEELQDMRGIAEKSRMFHTEVIKGATKWACENGQTLW